MVGKLGPGGSGVARTVQGSSGGGSVRLLEPPRGRRDGSRGGREKGAARGGSEAGSDEL